MRTTGKILIILAVVVGGLLLAKDAIIKSAVKHALKKETGFDLAVGSINVALLKQSFEVTGLKVLNPSDFPERDAFDIDRLYVQYDLFSFFSPTTHLRRVMGPRHYLGIELEVNQRVLRTVESQRLLARVISDSLRAALPGTTAKPAR